VPHRAALTGRSATTNGAAASGLATGPDDLAARLVDVLHAYGPTLVALSGGVDSSVVVAAAVRALGSASMAALTASSPAVAAAELEQARQYCATLGVTHHVVATRELDVAGYRDNGPRRCYFCKATLLDAARDLAVEQGYAVVATGTNASDVAAGFRPGIRAAAERGVRAPLAEAGLTKADVRAVARHWTLPMWDKPAAACLSSRIAYGVEVTPARLARLERAELDVRNRLAPLGIRDLRVRDLGDAVRVEVDAALLGLVRKDPGLPDVVRAAGFTGADVVVEAFRSGSMNELLADPQRWQWA
jgi:pyridinium-3,5-biscarboxylic acid mononucleotide sulfurtransferase